MGTEKLLARDVFSTFSINTGTDAVPVWTPINGLTEVTPDASSTTVDDTDYNSQGVNESKVAERSKSFTIKGNYLEDPDTGDQDAGQAAVIAAGDAIGYASNKGYQYETIGGNQFSFKASAEVKFGAGGNNDDGAFEAKLTVSGPVTFTPAA